MLGLCACCTDNDKKLNKYYDTDFYVNFLQRALKFVVQYIMHISNSKVKNSSQEILKWGAW